METKKKENKITKKYNYTMTPGRPPKYKDKEQLQQAINRYINDPKKINTITGLCYYLGFCSKQSFFDLEKRDEFSYTIRKARLFIESEYEQDLKKSGGAGNIFALKNMGWSDRQEVKHEGEINLNHKVYRDNLIQDIEDAENAE